MKKRFIFLPLFLFAMTIGAVAQSDSAKSSVNVSADIFSRYIWRGLDYGSGPSIQPTLEYVHKSGLTIGYWGAYNIIGTYNESDLYLTYGFGKFEVTATDYFFPISGIPTFQSQRYLNYDNATTGHIFEGLLKWKGTDKFPLTLQIGTSFYGADKKVNGDQNYSTYVEALYTFEKKAGKFDAFMGFTPDAGLYGNTMGVVNIGITGYRNVKISDEFTLPMQASIVVNPQVSNIYFTLGVTL